MLGILERVPQRDEPYGIFNSFYNDKHFLREHGFIYVLRYGYDFYKQKLLA